MNTSLGAIPEMLYCNSGTGRGGFPDIPVKARADMKWFRSNIRLGSRLALFALAIQFLLSFGHFHGASASAAAAMDAKRSGLHHAVGIAVARLSASEQTSPGKVLRPVGPKTPSGHAPSGHPGDDCAICAVMALASAMVDAAPPLLLSPQATAFSYFAAVARCAEPNSTRAAFQPRAPPIA